MLKKKHGTPTGLAALVLCGILTVFTSWLVRGVLRNLPLPQWLKRWVVISLTPKDNDATVFSACQSGSQQGSHVIRTLQELGGTAPDVVPLRVSLSRYSTMADVQYFLRRLGEVLGEG
jgi:cysteine sulfinate desulfinase/cysteine desulfurase-like protein